MSFEEFLKLVRERIGNYCTDAYWEWKYEHLQSKTKKEIMDELPQLAINAIATDYSGKYL